MAKRLLFTSAIVCILVLIIPESASFATPVHTFGEGEYLVIRNGLSPDRSHSIAAHGSGEMGGDDFRLYLMAEPAHGVLDPLAGIGGDATFDTDPEAFRASWSPDSRYVAVHFRFARTMRVANIYGIYSDQIHLMIGPGLFESVTKHSMESYGADLRQILTEVTWFDRFHFYFKEYDLFQTSSQSIEKDSGAFSRREVQQPGKGKEDESAFFLEFSALAECEIAPDGKSYRILWVRPGRFQK